MMENFFPAETDFSAELIYLPVFNLALQQNAFPVVSELKLKNHLGRNLAGLDCEFSANPLFILPKTIHVDELANGVELSLHDLGIDLDYSLLASLSEPMKGKIRLEIRYGGEQLFFREYEVTAYAADQWLGLSVMPELLAAFVTPNLEAVSCLQAVVAEELRKATGDSSIQGYQADKTRVYEICSAIYRRFIHGESTTLILPPPLVCRGSASGLQTRSGSFGSAPVWILHFSSPR